MLNIKKLSREEMELITASGATPPTGGGSSNGGNMTCGEEPDPVTQPQAYEYWRSCTESGGNPTICPPGGLPTGS